MKRAFLFSVIFILLFTIFLLLSVFYLNILQMNELNLAETRNITRMVYTKDDITSDLLDYLELSVSIESNSTHTILNISDSLISPYTNPTTVLNGYKSFISGTYSNQTNLLPNVNTAAIWHFDEGNGTTVADSSGNNNTGSFYNTPAWVGGTSNSALQFTADEPDRIVVNDSSSLDLNGSLTVEMWFKPGLKINPNGWLLHKGNTTDDTASNYEIWIDVPYHLRGRIGNSTDSQSVMSSIVIQPDTWYHMAFTADGTNLSLYINGVLDNSTAQNFTPVPNDQQLIIGGRGPQAANHFNGTIDEVVIYPQAKSADEIAVDASQPINNKVSAISLNTTSFESSPSLQFINSNSSLNLHYGYNNLSKNELIINGSSLLRNYSLTMVLNNTCLNSNCANATWAGGPPNNDSSTRAMWHFDEGSGTTVTDSSGNGNTGSYGSWTSSTPQWVGGRFNRTLQFDYGNCEYISVNDSNSLDINGGFTVELWFMPHGTGMLEWLLNKGNSSDYGNSNYQIWLDDSPNKIRVSIGNGTADQNLTSTNTIQTNTWYHLAFTADGTNLSLYINGVLDNSTSQTVNPVPNSGALVIGTQTSSDVMLHFNGTIDEIAIYSRAKSADEIAADANLFHWDWGPIAINSNISAAWHFDEGTGNTTLDSSGNGNMGTFTGTTTATLIPSSTNKAYIVSSTTTDSPNQATTEFSSDQYNTINTSNDGYTTSTAQESITYAGCTMSDDTYTCKTGGESCTGNTCRFASVCANDTCNIGSCSAITHATGSSVSCQLTPTTGAYCGCEWGGCTGILPSCSGSSGTCTISGNCYYTCDSTWYDCDATADCETQTPCYLYGFQRYTFNLSAYDWATVTQLDFCFEGEYASTGGTASANLQWYNVTASAWVNTTAISTTEGTVCLNFSGANLTDVYNSTGTWVEFAARGNQSKDGYTITLSADYAYLNLSTVTLTAPWTVGKFGNAINFNGSGTYGQVNDSNSLDITDQLTIEAWINPATVTPPYQVIVHKGNSSTENYGLYLKGDEVYFEWVNSGLESAETTSANLQANTWYHIAAVFNYSGSSLKLYVDGAENASSSPSASLLADSTALEIGTNNSANYFNGTIDEVAIYSRAKSADEIAADATPIYTSLDVRDSLNNSISLRGATNGYLNPGANNTFYLKMNDNGNLNITVGAYSGFYSFRAYMNNARANFLIKTIQEGVSSVQAVLPIELQIYQQVFRNLIITEK